MVISKVHGAFNDICLKSYRSVWRLISDYATVGLFLFGLSLLSVGLVQITAAETGYDVSGPQVFSDGEGFGMQNGRPTLNVGDFDGSGFDASALPSLNEVGNSTNGEDGSRALNPRLLAAAGEGTEGGGFNTDVIEWAICEIFALMQGPLGGLLTAVAGAGAIVASAFGAYRAGFSLIVVAITSYAIQTLVAIYFGYFNCGS